VKQRLGDIDVSPSTFKDMVLMESITADFLGYMIYRVDLRKNELAYNTFRHHKATQGLLVQCFGNLPFSEINDESVFKFRRFMERRGSQETTISDKIKHIKIYFHLAKKEGLKFKMPSAKALKVVQPPSRVQALSREELKKAIELYKKQYLDDGLQQVLRLFLFSCFSGIRYGDIASLTHENFVDKTLIITPQKTKRLGKLLKIPLPSIALALIDKEDEQPLGKVISNQKINANLKKIKAYLGMPKGGKLHYHMSRHTFATQFLELGGNIEVLQTLLGHSSLKQTMIYAHVADKRRESQMDNFNNLFED
jgi:integrase